MIHYQDRWAVVTGAIAWAWVSCTTSQSSSAKPLQNTQALEYACYVDEHFIQKGYLGVSSGQGFYSHPNPAFDQPGFI